MSVRQLLLLSSSAMHGYELFHWCKAEILSFFSKNNVTRVLFVPYALKDHDAYTKDVAAILEDWGFKVEGIHTKSNPKEAVQQAQVIYIGGGNTFRLLKTLYDNDLVEAIRRRVLTDGIPYVGSSAGTNVATLSIRTTNDMPIVYPPSFDALQLVPFNINPHYLDADPSGTHKGETREQRIKQFHEENEPPVLGLREGSLLLVDGNKITLMGLSDARLFKQGNEPVEYKPNADLSFLLDTTSDDK